MPRLPDPPPTPFEPRCHNRLSNDLGSACQKPRMHLHGTPGRSDVWLCAYCDMGSASAGPPRLLAYLRTGETA